MNAQIDKNEDRQFKEHEKKNRVEIEFERETCSCFNNLHELLILYYYYYCCTLEDKMNPIILQWNIESRYLRVSFYCYRHYTITVFEFSCIVQQFLHIPTLDPRQWNPLISCYSSLLSNYNINLPISKCLFEKDSSIET